MIAEGTKRLVAATAVTDSGMTLPELTLSGLRESIPPSTVPKHGVIGDLSRLDPMELMPRCDEVREWDPE
jgi:hypothetical protein